MNNSSKLLANNTIYKSNPVVHFPVINYNAMLSDKYSKVLDYVIFRLKSSSDVTKSIRDVCYTGQGIKKEIFPVYYCVNLASAIRDELRDLAYFIYPVQPHFSAKFVALTVDQFLKISQAIHPRRGVFGYPGPTNVVNALSGIEWIDIEGYMFKTSGRVSNASGKSIIKMALD